MPPTRAPRRPSRPRLPLGGVRLTGLATATGGSSAALPAPAEAAHEPLVEPASGPSTALPADAGAQSSSTAPDDQPGPASPDHAREFVVLYQTWFRKVQRWVSALGGPAIDVDDLTQEVFLVAHRKLDRFDGANVGGWLYRIAQLTVSDHRQRVWFRKVVQRVKDMTLDDYASSGASLEEQLDGKKRAMSFYALVMQLNPKWRDSFLLFEVAGLSGQEIASLHGIPAATVRTHLARARKEMAELAAKVRADANPAAA